jgi:DNA-binding NarL/FixJ family response regulator
VNVSGALGGAVPPDGDGVPSLTFSSVERIRFGLHTASSWRQPVVLLDGLSGAGKTTLARQVARAFRRQGHNVASLNPACPVPARATLSAPGEAGEGAGPGQLLVVDNLHLARSPDALFSYLIDRRDHDSQIRILLTCDTTSSASAAVRGRIRDLGVIDSAELAFTHAEIAELLAGLPHSGSAPSVDELHAMTAGRPLSIRLALYGLQASVPQASASHQWSVDVWAPSDSEDAEILDRLSIPDRFTVTLAMALLGWDELKVTVHLQRLGSYGLVVPTVEDDAECYQIPSGLRRQLQARFRATSAFEYRRCCRAAALHLANGPATAPEAFRLAVAGHDWDLADRLASQRGFAIVDDLPRFAASSARIPRAEFARRPLLGIIVAIATVTSDSSLPVSSLIEATDRWLAAVNSSEGTTSLDQMVRAALTFEYSSLTAKQIDLARAEQILSAISRLTPAVRQSAAGGLALIRELVLATCALQAGSQVRDELQTLIHHCVARGDNLLAARAGCHLALAHAIEGQCRLATKALERTVGNQHIPSRADRLTLIDYELAQAIVATNELNLVAAGDITQRLIHDHPDVVQSDLFHALRLRAILLGGDRNQRHHALMTPPDGRRSPGSLYPSLLATARAELAISVGAFPWAEELLGDARLDQVEVAAIRAHLLQHCGDPRGALTEATRALSLRQGSARIRAIVLSVTTLALLDLGRTADAADAASAFAALVSATAQRARFAAIPRSRRMAVANLIDERSRAHAWLLDNELPDPYGDLTPPPALSQRERQVLKELADERTLAQIARDSGRSLNTVKHQVAGLYRKLGVNSRTEAVSLALSLWPSASLLESSEPRLSAGPTGQSLKK